MRRKIDVSRTASLSGADVVNERGPQLIHNQFWGTTFHGQDTVYSVFDVRDTRRLHAHGTGKLHVRTRVSLHKPESVAASDL
jgi:hypothetical protein